MNPLFVSLLFALFETTPIHAVDLATQKKLNEIAERGIQVMPFGLDKTTHVFSKKTDGGIQQVIAKDRSN